MMPGYPGLMSGAYSHKYIRGTSDSIWRVSHNEGESSFQVLRAATG
jgi:hypothetical protein